MPDPKMKKSLEKHYPIPSYACVRGYKVLVYFWNFFISGSDMWQTLYPIGQKGALTWAFVLTPALASSASLGCSRQLPRWEELHNICRTEQLTRRFPLIKRLFLTQTALNRTVYERI